MKIKILKNIVFDGKATAKGTVVEASDPLAAELVACGLAEKAKAAPKKKARK